MGRSVEKIYGDAFFRAAKEAGTLDQVYEEVKTLIKAYEGTADPATASAALSDVTFGFLSVVAEKNREDSILPILREFSALYHTKKGIGTARVQTAKELSPEKKEAVYQKLLRSTGLKTLEVEYEVDPTLIGGMVIFVGDRMIDGSVKTKLNRMEKELRAIQFDKA